MLDRIYETMRLREIEAQNAVTEVCPKGKETVPHSYLILPHCTYPCTCTHIYI